MFLLKIFSTNNKKKENLNQKVIVSSIGQLINSDEDEKKYDAIKNTVINNEEPTKEYILPNLEDLKLEKIEYYDEIKKLDMSKNEFILGKNDNNDYVKQDIFKSPNILIGGSVMTGKSVLIHNILNSILINKKPRDIKILLISSSKVEYNNFNGIPHLITPLITDVRKANIALKKIVVEIGERYKRLENNNSKTINEYNEYIDKINQKQGLESKENFLSHIVIIIDEYMSLNPTIETCDLIEKITQLGWKVGISTIMVVNHPSTAVISSLAKSNFGTRIAFKTTSKNDSKIIINDFGAEKLLGTGQALFNSFQSNIIEKVNIPLITEEDENKIVNYAINQEKARYDEFYLFEEDELNYIKYGNNNDLCENDEEPLYNEIVEFVVTQGKASASLLQRRFRLGYNRSARCIDLLEERGIIGPQKGSQPREVLVKIDKDC